MICGPGCPFLGCHDCDHKGGETVPSGSADSVAAWDNRDGPGGAVNANRSLTTQTAKES